MGMRLLKLSPQQFDFPRLRGATSLTEYLLHIAALEWSLDAPITIRDEADVQSRRRWQDTVTPYAHQMRNLITFCRRAPVALLADDVGLGKTISAALILSELIDRKKVSRALIAAPKILLPQWREELATKFRIESRVATGQELDGFMRFEEPVVITTYDSLRNRISELGVKSSFDMLILDEAHKLRNLHGTDAPPRTAVAILNALQARMFRYVLMLTATPIQNRVWDLYSLVSLLTSAKNHANPLGSPSEFQRRYVADQKGLTLRPDQRDAFRHHLSSYIVRTRRSDAKLVFPKRVVETIKVPPGECEQRLLTIVSKLFQENRLGGFMQSSLGQALMSSPQALATQMEGMGQSNSSLRSTVGPIRAACEMPDAGVKLAYLIRLISELASKNAKDWRLVVFTSRIETQQAIGRRLAELRIPHGFIAGGKGDQNTRAINDFRCDPPKVRVLVSTDSGAEGVNLQAANVLVNFDLPWNPMVLEQRIGRIQRLASKHGQVRILNLVLAGSVEEKVVGRLSAKLQTIAESIGDIEGILESASGDAGDSVSYEQMIRELVVNSLKGMNVEEATRAQESSIEEAKRLYEEEKDNVEKTLGDLSDLHRAGPAVPDIDPITPSMAPQEFVLGALRAEGAQTVQQAEDLWLVQMPGHNEFNAAFSEDAATKATPAHALFATNAPRVYIPGKRDFERLAQTWVNQAAAFIVDRRNLDVEEIRAELERWLANEPGIDLLELEVIDREEGFAGEMTARASIVVAHDKLEKLVTFPVSKGAPADVLPPSEIEIGVSDSCATSSLGSTLEKIAMAAAKADPDLDKFASFYLARLEEEEQAAANERQRAEVRKNFTPSVASTAVAVKGVHYCYFAVEALLGIDGHGRYPAEFEVLPMSRTGVAVKAKSPWGRCEVTGRRAPETAIERCAVTGARGLRHLMAESDMSGVLAMSSALVACEVTGDRVLPAERSQCAWSGKWVRHDLLVSSAVSGAVALKEGTGVCEFTADVALLSELAVSDISGRKFRADRGVVSVLSKRIGHESEFVMSAMPEGYVAFDEAVQSDVSGRWCDRELAVRSSLPSGRQGLPDESERSVVSGRVVLIDELVPSDVSGRHACEDEVVRCEITGCTCLPDELIFSDISGMKFRADQSEVSVVSLRRGHRTEFVVSHSPVGMLAKDEAEQSDASGVWVEKGVLVASARTPTLRAMPSELVVSAVSGKRVLPVEVVKSAISGKPATDEELEACDMTGVRVLPEELRRSVISGKRFRHDQIETSIVTGRSGHVSEFVESVNPLGMIASDEAVTSAISGRVGAKSEMIQSAADPSRFGLPEEAVTSVVSGKRYLADEVEPSQVSSLPAHPSEMAVCSLTGTRVLPGELAVSDVSGKQYRCDQSEVSVLSHRRGHATEFVLSLIPGGMLARDEAEKSDVGGAWVEKGVLVASARTPSLKALPSEMVTSAASGNMVLPSEVLESQLSGKPATPEELQVCEFTGVRVLPQELQKSDVSGRRFRIDQSESSVVSGRTGHRSEFVDSVLPLGRVAVDEAVVSAISGRVGAKVAMIQSAADTARFAFPEESVTSVVSGKSYLADEVERSQLSSLPAHPSEMAVCSVTGIRVLPAELVVSEVSGVAFRNDQVRSSQLSGRRGHFGEFVASVIPAGWLAIDEAERSEMSGDWGAKVHAVRSEKPPHRQGLRHELGVCDLTGAKLLRDELGLSSVSHRRVDVAFLVPSEASAKLALADELVVCEQTGRRLLPEETETCAITGKRVDCRELVASVLSGKKGISHQMVRCPESAKVVLPAETVKCEVTGRRLAVSEVGRCVITGRAVGLASMSACPLSGERYVDDETSKAETKRVMAVPDLLSSCEWTGRRQLTIKLVRCRLSNLLVDKSMVNERSELRVFRELLDGVDGLGGFAADARQLAWLRMASPDLGLAHSAEWVRSPAGHVLVGCVRVKQGLFGLGTPHHAAVVADSREGLRLRQAPLFGLRENGVWRVVQANRAS